MFSKVTSSMIFLFALLMTPLFADKTESGDAKYYCQPEQIEIHDSMLLVFLNDGVVEIDALHVDQGGIYFTQKMMRCTYCRRTLNPKNTCECPGTPFNIR